MNFLSKLSILFAIFIGVVPVAIGQSAQTAALDFVQRQHLGSSSLKTVSLAAAQRTQTYYFVVARLGAVEAKK